MSYNFWAMAQGTLDLDEEEKEQSEIEAEKHARSPTALSMGDATTDRAGANTVDLDEEEKEQALTGAAKVESAHTEYATTKSSSAANEDEGAADHGSRQETDINEFCSRLLPPSISTTTVSDTIYETLTAATTIFVELTPIPITNTIATITVTTTASPTIATIFPGLLQTDTSVSTIPMSPLDADVGSGMFVTRGPTTSAARAHDAVGVHIPRGTVAATLFLMCAWVVVYGGLWIRGTHFHRAMLLVVPAILPPIFVGCFMQEIVAMNYPLLSEPFVRGLLFTLGLCACLMFLEAFGVFDFGRQVWDAFVAWKSGKGWSFSWGWTKDTNVREGRCGDMGWVEYTERTERRRGGRDGRYVPAPW